MNTSLDDVDALARRLMVRVVDETPIAPTFESIIDGSGAARRRPAPGRTRLRSPSLAAAAAMVIVVGLVVIGRVRTEEPVAAEPTVLQLPTDVPDGWQLDRVLGPGTSDSAGFPPTALYATDAAPLGPIVAIDQFGALVRPTGGDAVETETARGRRIVFTDDPTRRVRVADVEMDPGEWVTVLARRLDDDALRALADTLVRTVDGAVVLDRSAPSPSGLSPAGTGSMMLVPFVAGRDSDPGSLPLGTTVSSYSTDGGDGHIDLLSYTPTAFNRAALGLQFAPSSTLDEPEGWVQISPTYEPDRTGWYVERDGIAHLVTGPEDATATMRALLDGLRPVDRTTWIDRAADLGSTAPPTTIVEPADTEAPTLPESGPILEIDAAVASLEDEGYEITLTAPGDEPRRFFARFVGRYLTVATGDPAPSGFATSNDISRLSGPVMSGESSADGTLALVVVPDSLAADQVELSIGGTTYVTSLLALDERYPLRVAVVFSDERGPHDFGGSLLQDGQVVFDL